MSALYDRDYLLGLTDEEKEQYLVATGHEFNGERRSGLGTKNNLTEMPKAARHARTLFPNNFMDNVDLFDKEAMEEKCSQFETFMDNVTTEREILNYIHDNHYYHVVASIIRGLSMPFGHHGTYVFPEFQIGTKYKADYLIIGKGSGGYEFILVEFESPKGYITLQDGELGNEIRDGISQLEDWRRILPQNYQSFSEVLRKSVSPEKPLPEECYVYEPERFHYVIVAGRREDFNKKTYTIRREYMNSKNITILHYDNLIDFSKDLIGARTY